jgi:O-antigen/teichoic acid export membrane protein
MVSGAPGRALNELDIAKRSVRGSLVLTVGNYLVGLLGAATTFVVARLLGPDLYGTYSLVLVIPGLLQLFVGFGVNKSVIRYTAFALSAGRLDEAKRYSLHATYFQCITGAAVMLFNYVSAGYLTGALLHRPDLTLYVQLMSLSTIGFALLQTAQFTALGWNWMALSSSIQVTQAIIKLALSPILVLIGLGVVGALWGHIVSLVAAGIFGSIAVYVAGLRRGGEAGLFVSDMKKLLSFGLPLYVGVLVWNLATYYSTIVLAGIATDTEFGMYRAALNFLLPVTLVSTALVNSLFPAFSSYDGVGGDMKVAFRLAYKFVAFLLTPLVVFLISTAPLLIHIFYGAAFDASAPYLRLLAFAYVPIAFGYTVHPAFFNGFGHPRLTLLVYGSGALALVVGSPLFSISLGLGINGIIYATFGSFLVAWAVGTFLADRFMGARLDVRANGAIIVASAISSLAAGVLPYVAHSSALSLLLDSVVFFGLYLTLSPVVGAISRKDLDVMGHAFKDLRVVGRLVGLLLRYERFLLSLRG